MREGRCISLIERLKEGSELKSTLSIGKLFQTLRTHLGQLGLIITISQVIPLHNIN